MNPYEGPTMCWKVGGGTACGFRLIGPQPYRPPIAEIPYGLTLEEFRLMAPSAAKEYEEYLTHDPHETAVP